MLNTTKKEVGTIICDDITHEATEPGIETQQKLWVRLKPWYLKGDFIDPLKQHTNPEELVTCNVDAIGGPA